MGACKFQVLITTYKMILGKHLCVKQCSGLEVDMWLCLLLCGKQVLAMHMLFEGFLLAKQCFLGFAANDPNLHNIKWQVVAIDEVHQLKTRNSKLLEGLSQLTMVQA